MPRRLAVLAGAGLLVPRLIQAAQATGDTVLVIALSPQAISGAHETVAVTLDDPAAILDALDAFAPSHLVLAGGVTLNDAQRRSIVRLLSTGAAAEAAGLSTMGDAALSGIGAVIAQRCGAQLLGAHDIARDLLAGTGAIAGPPVGEALHATARLALAAARSIGALDLGQAVVAVGQRIIAAEDIAGTDALIDRARALRAAGLTGDGGEPLVLAKASKPQQPLSVDMPAIGPDTITRCAEAGIGLVVLEAGRCLVLGDDELRRRASSLGISVIGLACDG